MSDELFEEVKIKKIDIVMTLYKLVALFVMFILIGLHIGESINKGQISNWSQALFYFLLSGVLFIDSYMNKNNKSKRMAYLYGGALTLVMAVAFLYEFAVIGR